MNKYLILGILCIISVLSFGSDDYVLTINGKSHDIGLESKKEISLPDGQKLNVELKMKDELKFDRPYFSFSHSSKYKPNVSDLGDGIYQTLLVTPDGTMVIIQEYSNMDPTSMIDLMLKELTKEEVDYGYKYKEKEVPKKLGKFTVNGKQAITTYKDNNWIREVCAIGGKDCGLLIITGIETESNSDEQFLIDGFWKTLKIKKIH